jgi:hypothetical protein
MDVPFFSLLSGAKFLIDDISRYFQFTTVPHLWLRPDET